MIKASSVESLEKLLEERKSTLAVWFREINPWNLALETIHPERVVWLNIVGIPVHAWHANTFEVVEIRTSPCNRPNYTYREHVS